MEETLSLPDEIKIRIAKERIAQLEIKHWAVRVLAWSLKDILGDAPNFVTMVITEPEEGVALTVTIVVKTARAPRR